MTNDIEYGNALIDQLIYERLELLSDLMESDDINYSIDDPEEEFKAIKSARPDVWSRWNSDTLEKILGV